MTKSIIKISTDEFRYISLFQTLTGAMVKDCFIVGGGERITFIVREGDMGLAIGKGGINVNKIEEITGKKVDLIEFSRDPVQFLKNIIAPIRLKNAYLSKKSSGATSINVQAAEQRDKKALLGGGKKTLNAALTLLRRHYDVDGIDVQ